MPELYTWQEADFDICSGRLDRGKSPYVDGDETYLAKLGELSKLLGTDQYLFCFCQRESHTYFEGGKEWEWVLRIPQAGVLGYVASGPWDDFFKHRAPIPALVPTYPQCPADWTAIVGFPVPIEWVVCRTEYCIHSTEYCICSPKDPRITRIVRYQCSQ